MATQAQRSSPRKAIKSLSLFFEFTLCQLLFYGRSGVVIQQLENALHKIQTSFLVLEKLFVWWFRWLQWHLRANQFINEAMKGNIFLSLLLESQMSCSVYSTIILEFNATPKIQQILTDVGGKWWDRVKLHLTFIDYGFRSLSLSGQRFPDKSCGQSMLRTTSYDRKIRDGENLLSSGRQNFFKKGPELGLNTLYNTLHSLI